MIEPPKCMCFSDGNKPPRGNVVADSIGNQITGDLVEMMEESYVCDDARDYVLLNVVTGLLFTNVTTRLIESGAGITLDSLPALEKAARELMANMPDMLAERLAVIELGMRKGATS